MFSKRLIVAGCGVGAIVVGRALRNNSINSTSSCSSESAVKRKKAGGDPFSCQEYVCQGTMDKLQNAMRSHSSQGSTVDKAPKEVIKAVECPMDRDEVGRATWGLLHTLAAYYPNEPSTEQQVHAELLMRSLAQLYPCKECAADFQEYVRSNPPKASSREALVLWVCGLHGATSQKLNKPIDAMFECNLQALDERWRYGSKACWERDGEEDDEEDKDSHEKL